MRKVKITFLFTQDEDGYPPFASESVWATPTELDDQYVIDNIPFFATQATLGDVAQANKDGDRLLFERLIRRSGSTLVRVVIHEPTHVRSIRSQLEKFGCSTEAFEGRSIVAVDIPAEIDYAPVKAYLDDLEQRDIAGYEEPILRHPSHPSLSR